MPGTEPLDILLHSTDPAQCLDALRYLKNQIIGSNHRKVRYVEQGIIPILLRALEPQVPADFQVQAAVTLGSLAYGMGPPEVVNELFNHNVEESLLVALGHSNIQVVESAARSLKILYKARPIPHKTALKEGTVRQLVVLMTSQYGSVPELAAGILARGCGTPLCQAAVVREGGLTALLGLLQSKSGKAVEAALDAISALTNNNPELAAELTMLSPGLLEHLFDLCKDDRSNIRLLATTCVANMAAARVLDMHGNTVEMTIVPSLVKLCSDGDLEVRARAHVVLASLVESSESLSKAASEADALAKLQDGLTNNSYPEPMRTKLLEVSLLAIAALCAVRDANRKLAQELGFIPYLKSCLDHPGAQVRIAACKCVLSLSRSVRSLRTNLVDHDIAAGVTAQLDDPDIHVQIAAASALCNLLLDFSPLKKTCLDEGAVQRLCGFVHSPEVELRRAAVFAIKNLLYLSDLTTKTRVAEMLGWGSLVHVLRDPDSLVQQHALGIVRNMMAGGTGNDIIDEVAMRTEGQLLPILVAHLNNTANINTLTEALYVVVNIATGDQMHQDAILANMDLMRGIDWCLAHNDPTLRVAAVWAIINLAWADAPGAGQRIATMRMRGIDGVLGRLTGDADLDVRDRARTALQQFSKCP